MSGQAQIKKARHYTLLYCEAKVSHMAKLSLRGLGKYIPFRKLGVGGGSKNLLNNNLTDASACLQNEENTATC